jgi:hypothetical protein
MGCFQPLFNSHLNVQRSVHAAGPPDARGHTHTSEIVHDAPAPGPPYGAGGAMQGFSTLNGVGVAEDQVGPGVNWVRSASKATSLRAAVP